MASTIIIATTMISVTLLNFITFLLSILIVVTGVWLIKQGSTECDNFLDKPVIILSLFLILVSLAGIISACCGVPWLQWVHLYLMFLLLLILFAFTVFALVVTNKGAGKELPDRGYKEYRLSDYSHWLQKRVNSTKNWNKIRTCLIDHSNVCSTFHNKYANALNQQNHTINERIEKSDKLNALEAGCCKPSDDCGFTYVGPVGSWTNSTSTSLTVSSNPDCNAWGNDAKVMCFNCNSCKAGLLVNLQSDWRKAAIVNIVFLTVLMIVWYVGCCNFRNIRKIRTFVWRVEICSWDII